MNLNKAQKAALRTARDVPYAVVATSTARALVAKGYANYAAISPAPIGGTAISLTLTGRTACA